MDNKVSDGSSRSAGPPAFKMLRFSTEDFPENKGIEAYREIFGSTIVKHDIRLIGDQPFRFESTLCSLPGLGWASSLISPCHRWIGKKHIDSDDLILGIGLSGACRVQQRGREAVIGRGEAILTSSADPADVLISTTSQPISLRLPYVALRSRMPHVDDRVARCIRSNAEGLRLLTGYVGAIRKADLTRPELRKLVVDHVYDLVALVLGAPRDDRELAQERGARAARLYAILEEIERRSGEAGLNVAAVAELLGITPRYVHLVLEETGKSFSYHVLERRLAKAAALLRDPHAADRKIADIATRVGFSDLSYFNRAFRRRFDMTPSDMRHEAKRYD
jgi:AraC-like DNA-binding protein